MSYSSRKALRKAVAAEILTSLTQFQNVFDHLPKKLEGKSPICSVESGSLSVQSTPDEPEELELVICIWVRRDDASTAEDLLDDLCQALWNLLESKYNARPNGPSIPDYANLDGVPYRFEWHRVSFQWW